MANKTPRGVQVSPQDAAIADELLHKLLSPKASSADEGARQLLVPLGSHTGSWKSAMNRLVMAGLRPQWEDHIFDTFTDHLFEVLVEQGLLQVPDTRTPLAGLPARVPKGWLHTFSSERHQAAVEAFARTLETYHEPRTATEDPRLKDAG